MPTRNSRNSQRSQASQASQQNQNRSQTSSELVPEEQEILENNVVRYMLTFVKSKYPFRKNSVIKIALNGSGKHYQSIFQGAKQKLADIYGFDVYEVPQMNTNQGYIITTPFKELGKISTEKSGYVIVFLALSHIFMSGNVVTEESLFNFFKKLNWNFTNTEDATENLENIKNTIKKYSRMLYFEDNRNTVEASKGLKKISVEYRWGIRAEKELDKQDVLKFVSQVYGKDMTSYQVKH